MSYVFLNETFLSMFDGERLNTSDLEKYITFQNKNFILKHNIKALSQVLKFLKSTANIFILNGFMGSGKTYAADCVSDFLSKDVLCFKNSYHEAVNLDDIQLSIFKDFQLYHNNNIVSLPRVESNIFSDKINAYIKYCDKPMLFIFDSFEINMRSADTKSDILDFINYLSHFAKIKIIICSRTFKTSDLISDTSAISCTLDSISADEVYEYLDKYKINGSKYEIEELHKITRGHFLLLELSVFIMQLLGLSLTDFSSEYKKSTKNFLEFIISKILSVSTERFLKVLIFLALIRHDISLDFILNQNLAQEEDIGFLTQKLVITEKFDKYYIKDYIKSEFLKGINAVSKIKMHEFIKEVYSQELPLKPFERQLFLSRYTMRQEIAYHEKRISALEEEIQKSNTPWTKDNKEIPYLSYVRSSGYNVIERKNKSVKRNIRNVKIKNNNILLKNPSSDNLNQNLKDTLTNVQQNIQIEADIVPSGIDEYISLAEACEEKFKFEDAILYYRKALTYNKEQKYKEKEPLIYIKLANCYKRLQEIDRAVSVYEKAYQIYSDNSSLEEAYNILRTIAGIYCEVYKYDKAQEIYEKILNINSGKSVEITVRTYFDLAELEEHQDNIKTEKEYIKKAILSAQNTNKANLLSEGYFKYALLCDDINALDEAQKYYLLCIQVSNDVNINQNLASAYSNLAQISLYNKNKTAAKMYFELSIDADKLQKNFEGLYDSYTQLAKLTLELNPQKSLDYLLEAVNYAKKSEDTNLVVYSYIDLGDYYLSQFNYDEALRSYILAKTLAPVDNNSDLVEEIKQKLNRIKSVLGQEKYEQKIKEIKKFH